MNKLYYKPAGEVELYAKLKCQSIAIILSLGF